LFIVCLYEGGQWEINGEGLSGCIVMFYLAVLLTLDINTLYH